VTVRRADLVRVVRLTPAESAACGLEAVARRLRLLALRHGLTLSAHPGWSGLLDLVDAIRDDLAPELYQDLDDAGELVPRPRGAAAIDVDVRTRRLLEPP